MYGIIYFSEDHTLSTIKKNHRDLSTTSFEAGFRCVMKWGSRHFDGTIIKVGEKEVELKRLADKLVVVLKKLGKGENAEEALFRELKRMAGSHNHETTNTTSKSIEIEKSGSKTSLLETWKLINSDFTDTPKTSGIQPPATEISSANKSSSIQTSSIFPLSISQAHSNSHSTSVLQPMVMQSPLVAQSTVTQSPSLAPFPLNAQSPSTLYPPFATQSSSACQSPIMQTSFSAQSTSHPSVTQTSFVADTSPVTQSSFMLSPSQSVLKPLSTFQSQSSPSDIQKPSTFSYMQLQQTSDSTSDFQALSCQPDSHYLDLDASSHMQALNNVHTTFNQPLPSNISSNTQSDASNTYCISPSLRYVLSQLIDPQIQQEIKVLLSHSENEDQHPKSSVKRTSKTRLFPPEAQQTPGASADASFYNAGNTEVEDDVTFELRCSPRKKSCTMQKPEDQCQQKMVKLVDNNSTLIASFKLRKATSAALKNFNPGFCLMGKLIPEVISRVDLARSKGQGIGTSNNKDDFRSSLDPIKVAACKGYVRMWCKEHNKQQPDETQLNKAITQQIDYSRKLLKKLKM